MTAENNKLHTLLCMLKTARSQAERSDLIRFASKVRGRRIVADALWAALGVSGTSVVSLLQVLVISRWADNGDYGKATLVLGAVGLANGLLIGPLSQSHLRLLFDYRQKGLELSFERVYTSLQVQVSVACVGAYLFFACAMASQGKVFYLASLPCACVMLSVQPQLARELNRLEASRHQRSINVTSLLIQAIILVVLIVLLRISTIPGDVAVLVAQLAGPLAALLWLRRGRISIEDTASAEDTAVVSKKVMGSVFSYGWSLPLTWLTYWLMSNSDRYFLESFLSEAAVGTYSVNSSLWSKPFMLLNGTLETLTRSLVYRSSTGHQGPSVWAVLKGRLVVTAVASVLAIVAIMIAWKLADDFVLAPHYRGTRSLAITIAVAYTFHAVAHCFTPVLLGRGLAHLSLVAAVSGAAASASCNYFLIPKYGMSGAASAAVVGYLVFAVAMALATLAASGKRR